MKTLTTSLARHADGLASSAAEGKQKATMAKEPGLLGFLKRTLGGAAANIPTHSAEMRAPLKAMSLQDLDLDERTLKVVRAEGVDLTAGVGTARAALVQAQQKNMLEAAGPPNRSTSVDRDAPSGGSGTCLSTILSRLRRPNWRAAPRWRRTMSLSHLTCLPSTELWRSSPARISWWYVRLW